MKYQPNFESKPLISTPESPEFETFNVDTAEHWQSESQIERPFCFINRADDCVTFWGTDPNDAISPWRLRNWQNPKWSIIGMKYCAPGQCKCRTIFDATGRCPAIEKEISDFEEFEDLTPNGPSTWMGETSIQPTTTPRVLKFTANEVIDTRISVPAQYSLVRLSKNPATSGDSVKLLEAVKKGQLAGIYCVNRGQPAAKRAERLGTTWWTAIPKGEDAVLILDPDDLHNGPPLIAFRRELDPRKDGCGSLSSDTSLAPSPARLDAALIRAWGVYVLFQAREIVPCSLTGGVAVSPSGQPTVPQTCRVISPPAIPPWIQPCLNRVLGIKLTITNVLDVQTRTALRTFRERNGLHIAELEEDSAGGVLDAVTQQALKRFCGQSNIPPYLTQLCSSNLPARCKNEAPKCSADRGWGRRRSFQEMWDLIIEHYYCALPGMCNFNTRCVPSQKLRDIFSPELLIAIFFEETRFANIPQKPRQNKPCGPAYGFGQVQKSVPEQGKQVSAIWLACQFCGVNPTWSAQDILCDDSKSVKIAGMLLWRLYCLGNRSKNGALLAYAGNQRQTIVQGWLDCEKRLKEIRDGARMMRLQEFRNALNQAVRGRNDVYKPSTDDPCVFPKNQLPNLSYKCSFVYLKSGRYVEKVE